MPAPSLYSTRSIRFKFAEDSAYRVATAFIDSQREITGSNVASFRSNFSLTSNQSAYTVNFQDVKGARFLFVDSDQSVKIVMNGSASMICGLTSVAKTVGRPCLFLEGSITSLTVANRVPSAATSVRVVALGTSV